MLSMIIIKNTWCTSKKGVYRNCAKFTGKQLCYRIFFNKVAGLGNLSACHKIRIKTSVDCFHVGGTSNYVITLVLKNLRKYFQIKENLG